MMGAYAGEAYTDRLCSCTESSDQGFCATEGLGRELECLPGLRGFSSLFLNSLGLDIATAAPSVLEGESRILANKVRRHRVWGNRHLGVYKAV